MACFISAEIIYISTCSIWVIFVMMTNPDLNMFKEVSWLMHNNNNHVSWPVSERIGLNPEYFILY